MLTYLRLKTAVSESAVPTKWTEMSSPRRCIRPNWLNPTGLPPRQLTRYSASKTRRCQPWARNLPATSYVPTFSRWDVLLMESILWCHFMRSAHVYSPTWFIKDSAMIVIRYDRKFLSKSFGKPTRKPRLMQVFMHKARYLLQHEYLECFAY